MIDLKNLKIQIGDKPIAILGLGKSGIAAFKACQAAGIKTILWDDNPELVAKAEKMGATTQNLNEADFLKLRYYALHQGYLLLTPEPHPVIDRALTAGCEITCDIELFYLANKNIKTIGITGTNGKSTTTALIGHILESAGIESAVGGNIGEPVLALPQLSDKAIYVFELSSFQLDLCQDYAPDISILVNISPDHLDRHGSMERYIQAKKRIFRGGGVAIISIDDRYCGRIYKQLKSKGQREVVAVSCLDTLKDTVYVDPEGLLYCRGKQVIDLNDCEGLPGAHNWQNAAIAFAACTSSGMEEYKIIRGLETFGGLEHRQNKVAEYNNIIYINDSKATNDQSAAMALATYNNIYWIAGGKDKGAGYSSSEKYFKNIKHAFLIGAAAENIAQSLKSKNIPYSIAETLENAVSDAKQMAEKDKTEDAVVLLSPACSSFDQFKSFEHRGEVFTQLVKKAIGQKG